MTIRRRPSRSAPARLAALVTLCLAAACSPGGSPTPTDLTATGPIASSSPSTVRASPTGTPPTSAASPVPVSRPSSFPPVVTLPWLDGVAADPAIRVDADGVVRWQGRKSGEQAELFDGGYRWVGADGSMIGCSTAPQRPSSPAALRCVAIDAAGDTALTTTAKGPRTVFGPDANWLGEFDPGGDRLPTKNPGLPLSRRLAEFPVDLPALVDFATRRMPFSGGVTGNAHLITLGGRRVTSQRVGDFHARLGDSQHQLELRTEAVPFQPDAGYVTALAIGVPGHRIQFDLTGGLTVDGSLVPAGGTFRQLPLADGPVIGIWPADAEGAVDAVVMWSDGSTVAADADPALGMTVISSLPPTGSAAGLFGSAEAGAGSAATTTTAPATTSIPDASGAGRRGDLLPRSAGPSASTEQAVESWRVRPGESLFNSVPDPPASSGTRVPVSPAAVLAAQKYCAVDGIRTQEDLAACISDVSRTGDDGYVTHHVALDQAATRQPFPAPLVDQWPALLLPADVPPRTYELGESVDVAVAAGGSRVLRFSVSYPARIMVKAAPCPGDRGDRLGAARGEAALRIFGSAGQAVSERRPWCGTSRTDLLPAGVYSLVIAGPESGATPSVRLRVTAD